MWPLGEHVAQELLPLQFETVVQIGVRGYLEPLVTKSLGDREIRIPHGFRGVCTLLGDTAPQPGHGRTVGSVDLELDEFVAVHPHRPGRVDLRDDAAVDLEDAVRRVVGGSRIRLPRLVPPRGDVGDRAGGDGPHRAQQSLHHIVPMAEHVDGDPAAVLGAIVPTRPLSGLPVALEHPVTELPAHRQDSPEESLVDQAAQLDQPG